jgi:PIN domain nuclease of toxin-antitoxin system
MGRGVIVVDSSTLIAVMRGEPGAERVAHLLEGAAISTVNLAEVVAHAVRSGVEAAEARRDLDGFNLSVHAFGEEDTIDTGALTAVTARHGLSLGDRACLALARRLGARAVTADRSWRAVDVGVEIEVFR